MIKGKEKLNNNRIQVVYCQFHRPPGENKKGNLKSKRNLLLQINNLVLIEQNTVKLHKGFETWIGNVEIKTKSVHFYVQRSTKYPPGSVFGPITFDIEQLNVGGAMNLETGEFTAPVDGTYHFEFRCLKDKVLPEELVIYLRKRAKDRNNSRLPSGSVLIGKELIVAGTLMSNLSYRSTGSLTASLKLKASDVVNLYSRNRRDNLYDSVAHYTQFTGWLVEEDLAGA